MRPAQRPVQFTNEQIIEAGKELQNAGRSITGFALRRQVGGGDSARLKQVWDEHINSQMVVKAEQVAALPIEVEEEVMAVNKALAERISAIAIKLNDKAVKAAERRVAEIIRNTGEQREQVEREIADAVETVNDLEAQLDVAKDEIVSTELKLADSQKIAHDRAIEIAQLRERLTAMEQANRAAAEQQAAELDRANGVTAQIRTKLDVARKTANDELDRANAQLTTLKVKAEADQHQITALRDQFKTQNDRHAAELSKQEQQIIKTEMVRDDALKQVSLAREEAAKLRGQVETMQVQQSEFMRAFETRQAGGVLEN